MALTHMFPQGVQRQARLVGMPPGPLEAFHSQHSRQWQRPAGKQITGAAGTIGHRFLALKNGEQI